MRKFLLILLYIVIGIIIGISLPFRLFSTNNGEIPLFSQWRTMADWLLRILETLGAVSAVIVALFKEELIWFWKHPILVADINSDFKSDDKSVEQNIESIRYYKTINVNNIGKTTANDCQVIVDSISYKSSAKLIDKELLNVPQNIRWLSSGTIKEDLSKKCSRSFELFQILPSVEKDSARHAQAIPISLMIGGIAISPEHNGGEYLVTIRIEAEKVDPIILKSKIEWTGAWHNQKIGMQGELVISDVS